tara:strand:- start:234 stop:566 length:333 start_codon:yes stop_codon:yes gene_type:complete
MSEEEHYHIYVTDSCGDNSHTTSENDGGSYDTLPEAISAAKEFKWTKFYIKIYSHINDDVVWEWMRGDDEFKRITILNSKVSDLEEQVVDLKQKLEEANKEIAALKNNNQ